MARYKGPNFILELKLYPQEWHVGRLEHLFRCSEKIYNNVVYFANGQLKKMREDKDYIKILDLYNKEKDEEKKKQYGEELSAIREKYHLTSNYFESYTNNLRNKSYKTTIDSNTAQKLGLRVWKGVESCLFGKGKKVHFKKFNTLDSIEGKTNKSGIRFDKDTLVMTFYGMVIPVKIRKNDYYAKEALTNDISYCRIIRRPFENGYKYFVQIVFRGVPPIKPNRIPGVKKGNVAFDIGPTTVAAIGDDDGLLEPLCPKTVKECNKEIIKLSRQLERIRRLANPQNYNKNGTIKKGPRLWIKTKNYYKVLFRLKNMYRLKTLYLREYQAVLAKRIMALGDNFATETINFTSWQVKSKKSTEKTDKIMEKKDKNGNVKKHNKCKSKRNKGRSLNNNSPGRFVEEFGRKLECFNFQLEEINTKEMKASQYNHDTDTCVKIPLSQRCKIIDGRWVQRDLYSAYVVQNRKDSESVDRDKCIKGFDNFIEIQTRIIKNLKERGDDLPKCMGI